MRKTHRKQRLARLLTAALLLTHLPVFILSEEIIENPIQTEIVEQNEPETAEEPNLPDFPTEEPDEPIEPPVSEELDEMPESGGQSEIAEIPADKDSPNIPDQDESETSESSDSGMCGSTRLDADECRHPLHRLFARRSGGGYNPAAQSSP